MTWLVLVWFERQRGVKNWVCDGRSFVLGAANGLGCAQGLRRSRCGLSGGLVISVWTKYSNLLRLLSQIRSIEFPSLQITHEDLVINSSEKSPPENLRVRARLLELARRNRTKNAQLLR